MNRLSIRSKNAAWATFVTAAALCLALAPAAAAQEVAQVRAGSGGLDFLPVVEHGGFVLTVSGPEGFHHRAEFGSGESPSFSIFDHAGGVLPDGVYNYELRVVPNDAQRRDAFEANQVATKAGAGLERPVQSGAFSIVAGSVVAGGETEPGAGPGRAGNVLNTKDQVIPDDLIVQRSLCVGFDCVNNEDFGFDTIRLKENNTRIRFFDTSVGSFPSTDWQLTANDSASGGANKFSIEDITGARVPFTIEGGSTTHSIYVDSTGRVGFRTSTPVLDIHVATSNTPGMRLEQTSAGGFTAQTWDIAGNEANFFVRDVTTGSKLPFRIRPNAPTSSIDIAANGDVGIGTPSPEAHLEVEDTGDTDLRITKVASGATETQFRATVTTNNAFFGTSTNDVMALTVNAVERMRINTAGNVGIGCQNPGSDLVVGSAADCGTAPASSMDAGDSTFTVTSSRTLKKNLSPVQVPDILEKIGEVGVYEYDFINGPEDKIGLMAEDFHRVFGRGSEQLLNGQEVQMAIWIAVQELVRRNEELSSRNDLLEDEIEKIRKSLE